MRRRMGVLDWITWLLVLIGALACVVPFYWMFAAASRPATDVLGIPPRWDVGQALQQNFRTLMETGLLRAFVNSAVIAVVSTVLTLLVSTLAGYALVTYKFKGRGLIFALILGTLFVPLQATVIPLFKLLAGAQLLNTLWGVILPSLASPFAIFFMRQAFLKYPMELSEAGRIDGASDLRIFWSIALPAVLPSVSALAVFVFLGQWNSFFWPLVVLNSLETYTLPVALSALNASAIVDYGAVMLGVALTTLPVLLVYLMARRIFTSAVVAGSVKG